MLFAVTTTLIDAAQVSGAGPPECPDRPPITEYDPGGSVTEYSPSGADPRRVAVPASMDVGREVQPAALQIGRGPSWQAEVSFDHAVWLRVTASENQQCADHQHRQSRAHATQCGPSLAADGIARPRFQPGSPSHPARGYQVLGAAQLVQASSSSAGIVLMILSIGTSQLGGAIAAVRLPLELAGGVGVAVDREPAAAATARSSSSYGRVEPLRPELISTAVPNSAHAANTQSASNSDGGRLPIIRPVQ